jgi:hypothetical protein
MNRQEIEKLLGGYATGTLTPQEEQALFAAALEDQRLFNALAREQPLRELLRDPAARAALLAALDETPAPVPWYRRFAVPLVVAAALVCVALPLALRQARHSQPQPVLMANRVAPPAPPAPVAAQETALSAPTPKPPAPRPVARKAKPEPQPVVVNAPLADALPPVVPARKAAAPQQAELKVGSTAESVEVTAQAAPQLAPPASAPPQLSTVQGFLPAQGAAAPAQARMASLAALASPLKWSVLTRRPDGEFAAADPADLKAGDIVEVRLESPQTGYVYVAEDQALLASSPIEAGKPFDALIEPRGAGQRQIECWFSPQPMIWSAAGAAGRAGSAGGSARTAGRLHLPSIHVTLNYK